MGLTEETYKREVLEAFNTLLCEVDTGVVPLDVLLVTAHERVEEQHKVFLNCDMKELESICIL